MERSGTEGHTNNYYQEKLAEEIRSNEVAVELILNTSYKLNKIINMLKESSGFNEESTYVK